MGEHGRHTVHFLARATAGEAKLSNSSLRTRIAYDIAVRYATPLWRVGAAFRAACVGGLWVLLAWFPPGALLRAVALLLVPPHQASHRVVMSATPSSMAEPGEAAAAVFLRFLRTSAPGAGTVGERMRWDWRVV